MNITSFACSPYQTNSYLVETDVMKLGFIVDPGGFVPALVEKAKSDEVDIKYIILSQNKKEIL